jgi:hypothetical protein
VGDADDEKFIVPRCATKIRPRCDVAARLAAKPRKSAARWWTNSLKNQHFHRPVAQQIEMSFCRARIKEFSMAAQIMGSHFLKTVVFWQALHIHRP